MTSNAPSRLAIAAAVSLLTLAGPAAAHPPASRAEAAKTLQGDQQSWINDPHMHAFYDASRAAFAGGSSKVDVSGYEQTSFAIFRDFGASRGIDPARMQDHLKLIPRQVVEVVREDPHVLDSYDNFVAATFGPQ